MVLLKVFAIELVFFVAGFWLANRFFHPHP
jgi:hypothetical protein